MEISPDTVPWKSLYKLMTGTIVPRPIGWISTVNESGQPNLAPFSFFNAVCPNPPHVMFASNIRGTDGAEKDTLKNLRATAEFVVNIVTVELAEAMNITSTEFPPGVNEIDAAGLTSVPSAIVRPPRVAESPVHYECRVTQIIDLGQNPGSASVVIGRVVYLHIQDSLIYAGDKIRLEQLNAIGRLAGNFYCRTTALFEMKRPPTRLSRPNSSQVNS